jgi:hypothetical protein
MSSFHFLPIEKPTWEIHAALWNGARGDPILMEGTVVPRSNRRGRQTGYPWHQLEYATGVGGFHGIPLGAPRAEKG